MPTMIVDSRESRSGLKTLLEARGIEVLVEELECADVVLADGLAVERKAANDFILSIENRRIFTQLAVCKKTYARVFVIVEGDIFKTRSTMAEDALLGALSYISLLENVPVLFTSNTAQTSQLLIRLQKHALEGLGYEIALRGAKPKDRYPQSQYLVEGLPGVGPAAAKKLLTHFGTASAVLQASVEELRNAPGIGPKTASSIREVLDFDTRDHLGKVTSDALHLPLRGGAK